MMQVTEASTGGNHESTAVPNFFFNLALRPRTDAATWERTVALLGETLRSLLAQDDPDFEVIIVGHDRPDLPELEDRRVSFLAADCVRPASSKGSNGDAIRKRQIAAAEVGRRGGGYLMVVDADDLVHHGVVSFVRRDRNPVGYMVRGGLVFDHAEDKLGLLPDAVRIPQLWANCGTCAIFRFEPRDLPRMAVDRIDIDETGRRRLYQKLKGHRRWESKMMANGRFVSTVPFRAVIYRMNTGANLSYDVRGKALIDELLRSTRERPLDLKIKREQFDG